MHGCTLLHGTLSCYCNFFDNRKGGGIGDTEKSVELKSVERYSAFEKKDGGTPRSYLPGTMKEGTRGQPTFSKAGLALEKPRAVHFTRKFVGASRTPSMQVEQSTKMLYTSGLGRKQKIELLPAGVERWGFR